MAFQFRKEAIEEDLNSNFPSQGQGNPPLYYSLSEVVVPTYSINQSAEGTSLPQNLQTSWDFATSRVQATNNSQTLINTPGFWQVDLQLFAVVDGAMVGYVDISDGLTSKQIWRWTGLNSTSTTVGSTATDATFVVFVRSGDTVSVVSNSSSVAVDAWTRQIADVNGNLVNPLGFSFA
jgi:hypothetical protein